MPIGAVQLYELATEVWVAEELLLDSVQCFVAETSVAMSKAPVLLYPLSTRLHESYMG